MNSLRAAAIRIVVGIAALLLLACAVYFLWRERPALVGTLAPEGSQPPETSRAMLITSPSFENNGMIPKKFTCDGGNMNPELQVHNIPPGAKSLALILHDSDAPVKGGFTHWVVWNISPATTLVRQESVPQGGVEGRNSSGKTGYTGPCPPPGAPHHYEFRFYALDTVLALPLTTQKADLEAAMAGHILEETALVGLYQR